MTILNTRGTIAFNSEASRRFPISIPAGATVGNSGWSVATGAGTVVATNTHLYYVEGTVVKKMDPVDGSIVNSRDFSPATVGTVLGGGTVGGVDRIYVLTGYAAAAPTLYAISPADLSTIWSQAFTGNTLGIQASSLTPFVTASGLLVCGVDNGSPYKQRAIKDNGATATYFWTTSSGFDFSFGCTSYPGATKLYRTRSNGDAISILASDGSTGDDVAVGFTPGIAPAISGTTLGFGRKGSAPYDIEKIALSDCSHVASLSNPFSGGTIAGEPAIDSLGYIYIWSGTSLKCYDGNFNLQWTYTHFESIGAFFLDDQRRLYITGATKVQSLAADRSLLWEISYTGGAPYLLYQISAEQLIALKAGAAFGITLTLSMNIDRVFPIHWRGQPVFDRVMPVQYKRLMQIDREFNILYDIDNMLRVSRTFPVRYAIGLEIDRKFPIYIQGPQIVDFNRTFPVHYQTSLNINRAFPILYKSTPVVDAWTKEASDSDLWTKEDDQSDTWVKEPAKSDSWSKE
jgi:hypothetical protein